MDKKRQYTKKNTAYWNEKSKAAKPQTEQVAPIQDHYEPELCGSPFVEHAVGSSTYGGRDTSGSTSRRKNNASTSGDPRRFEALRNTGSPFLESEDAYHIKEAIELCKKAYYNVATFANSIDIMSEFANADHYLDGGTAASRKFFKTWLDFIDVESMKQQYFREYFRSGNIFYYRVEGDLDIKGVKTLSSVAGKPVNKIPVKYILLNPADIVAHRSLSFDDGSYAQILSTFQLQKLRSARTEKEKLILNSFPADVKAKITNGEFSTDGLMVNLDAEQTLCSFYKKQDYEPFSVPFGYRVLDDINAKLELKKIDSAIARTVENVVLLITMGESAKDGGSGVNAKNIKAMQGLFANESIGRALVSDYTTKADFIIPDLKKVMGKEKYEILNQDIKEGLQNIIVGSENYSSTQVKANMFLERLREARNSFLTDIILPEMKAVSASMGFKKPTELKFKDFDLQDENTMLRVVTRLVELTVLTPEQGMDVIHTGEFPNSDNLKKGHERFVEDRKKGLYNPLVGGVPVVSSPDAVASHKLAVKVANQTANQSAATQPAKNTVTQNKTPKSAGRPTGKATVEDFTTVVGEISDLDSYIVEAAKEKSSVTELNDSQNSLCRNLCMSIVESADSRYWKSIARECIDSPNEMLKLSPKDAIKVIQDDHDIDSYSAALLYHATKKTV